MILKMHDIHVRGDRIDAVYLHEHEGGFPDMPVARLVVIMNGYELELRNYYHEANDVMERWREVAKDDVGKVLEAMNGSP